MSDRMVEVEWVGGPNHGRVFLVREGIGYINVLRSLPTDYTAHTGEFPEVESLYTSVPFMDRGHRYEALVLGPRYYVMYPREFMDPAGELCPVCHTTHGDLDREAIQRFVRLRSANRESFTVPDSMSLSNDAYRWRPDDHFDD